MDAAESARVAFADALRPIAERPDSAAVLAAAGWTREQLDAVLARTTFPPMPATLALIGAAGGDVAGWQGYWGQIAAVLGPAAQATPAPAAAPTQAVVPTQMVPAQAAPQPAAPTPAPAPAAFAQTVQLPPPPAIPGAPGAPLGAPPLSPSRAPFSFEPLAAEDPQEIGGYKLRARLGSGGMGRVYLSFTPGGRPLALKVVREEFAADPEFRMRFQQETAAAQRVHGLYTAQVVDFDANGPRPWLATAFVPGPALSQAVVAYGPLPPQSIRLLMAGVAEALAAIHSAGVVHRDLKPANVLLAGDGPKVIDFGIARSVDATPLTSSGVQIGTPMFMAPEQVLGKSATPATDVHALGALALYAAVRRAPYGEGNSHAVMYRIMNEEPDLSDCPEDLKPLIEKCLAKDPANRPTPAEIISALQEGAADATALKMTDGWLPSPVTADIAARTTARLPEERTMTAAVPPPAAAPAARRRMSWKVRLTLLTVLILLGAAGGAWAAIKLTDKKDGGTAAGNGKSTGGTVVGGQVNPPAVGASGNNGAATSPAAGQDGSSTPAPPTDTSTSDNTVIPGSGYRLGDVIVPETPNIVIASGYGLDLSNSPTVATNDSGDFQYYHGYGDPTVRYDQQTVLLDKNDTGDFATCNTDAKYLKETNTALAQLPVGSRFCVHASHGRIALIKITGLPDPSAKSDFITVDVIVWQGLPQGNN